MGRLSNSKDPHVQCILQPSARRGGLAVAGLLVALLSVGPSAAEAGPIFGFTGSTIGGGFRWDADPLTINLGGTLYERSLAGGLRYSLEGGSFEAFRDMFSWTVVPSVLEFSQAIASAFAAWTSIDPVTGLTTALSFVADLTTPVEGTVAGGGVNTRGAEIDLLASIDAGSWDPGSTGTQGETFFNTFNAPVTLTSGTVDYAGTRAIAGADITINSNPGALYSLDFFRRLLTHEIGHAIGLGDVEGDINPGAFIDDNYNPTNSATALATLTNSWAALVNPLNPAASPLARYTVAFGNPGTTTPGVNILMESRGLGIAAGNPVTNLVPLTNDDYGTRQFLYPSLTSVPEPGSLVLLASSLTALAVRRRRRALS
jgi:hypothetical protein